MKTGAFPARWAAVLTTGALLTAVFASGCVGPSSPHPTGDPQDNTIHVPPGKTNVYVPTGSTIHVPPGSTIDISGGDTITVPLTGAMLRVPTGLALRVTDDGTDNHAVGAVAPGTIHVPPGGANDTSKDRPRHRHRRHHRPAPVRAATPAPTITHPGG